MAKVKTKDVGRTFVLKMSEAEATYVAAALATGNPTYPGLLDDPVYVALCGADVPFIPNSWSTD